MHDVPTGSLLVQFVRRSRVRRTALRDAQEPLCPAPPGRPPFSSRRRPSGVRWPARSASRQPFSVDVHLFGSGLDCVNPQVGTRVRERFSWGLPRHGVVAIGDAPFPGIDVQITTMHAAAEGAVVEAAACGRPPDRPDCGRPGRRAPQADVRRAGPRAERAMPASQRRTAQLDAGHHHGSRRPSRPTAVSPLVPQEC